MSETAAEPSPALAFRNATVAYGRGVPTLHAVDLEVARGELHVLLGPSGSGKTTLLRTAAGFEVLQSGTLHLAGRLVDDGSTGRRVPPEARGIGYVFQDYALFPDRTVAGNIAFPMVRPDPARVAALVEQVGLAAVADRLPAELSGGQQQRVALARALARSPQLMLLDEPFSNIDKSLRRTLRESTRGVIRETGLAALFVTHDAEEAMALADRLTVLAEGRILQTGDAVTLYRRPVDLEVARTFGDVALLDATARGDGTAQTPLGVLAAEGTSGDALLFRPEDFEVRAADAASANATLERVTFLGPFSELSLRVGAHSVIPARTRPEQAPAPGPVRVDVRRPGWLIDRSGDPVPGPVLTMSSS